MQTAAAAIERPTPMELGVDPAQEYPQQTSAATNQHQAGFSAAVLPQEALQAALGADQPMTAPAAASLPQPGSEAVPMSVP